MLEHRRICCHAEDESDGTSPGDVRVPWVSPAIQAPARNRRHLPTSHGEESQQGPVYGGVGRGQGTSRDGAELVSGVPVNTHQLWGKGLAGIWTQRGCSGRDILQKV